MDGLKEEVVVSPEQVMSLIAGGEGVSLVSANRTYSSRSSLPSCLGLPRLRLSSSSLFLSLFSSGLHPLIVRSHTSLFVLSSVCYSHSFSLHTLCSNAFFSSFQPTATWVRLTTMKSAAAHTPYFASYEFSSHRYPLPPSLLSSSLFF